MKKIIKCILCFVVAISTFFSGYSLSANESEQLINVAPRGEAYSSQVTTDNNNSGPEHINDDIIALNSFWDSGKKETDDVYIVLDLKREYDVREIRLFNYWGPIYGTQNKRWYKYEIYSSVDNKQWELVGKKDTEEYVSQEGDLYQLATPKIARYIKVKCIDSNIDNDITHIVELQVFAPVEESDINIALNKPVAAIGSNVNAITDGNMNGYWDGGMAPSIFTIDLEDYYDISSFHAYPYVDGKRGYTYDIAVSDNGFNYTTVAQKTNPTTETNAGQEFVLAEAKVARYVRVTMYGNTVNEYAHMREFEVYGVKHEGEYIPEDPSDTADPNNIAFGKITRANTGKIISSNIVDGDLNSAWSASTFPANVDIDLGKSYDLTDIKLYFPNTDAQYYKYTIYGSMDGVNFDRFAQKRDNEYSKADGDVYDLSGKTARYIRVNVEFVSSGINSYLSEVRIHGVESATAAIDRPELVIDEFKEEAITSEDTINEVYNLIDRRLGAEYRTWFTFELEDGENDYFEISDDNGKIHIKGNKGVSLTSGLYHYLKYFCNVQITQQTDSVENMPSNVIPVGKTIKKDTTFDVRYAYNYCTLSYTNAFYGEEDWLREIDWLALNGVNLVLDTTGQEAVWIEFLRSIGYSTDDAKAWLTGPAYTAWQFMSNMENYGGPIHDQYVLDRLALARKNQRLMRTLGMDVVLQGYAGMIPSDYNTVADLTVKENREVADAMMVQGSWGGQFTRPAMLKTDEPIFKTVAEKFYVAQKKVLGDITNYYAVDPFHEGGIRPPNLSETDISRLVLGEMMKFDENAVWTIQSWEGNPTKALLDGLGDYREEHALILDLTSTTDPHYNNSRWGEEFYGTPWVYCMLDNFGDRPGVHGELPLIATDINKAKENSKHMRGIGITPEGTKLNPVNYELFFETVWSDGSIDINDWIKDYITRRYGEFNENAYKGWLYLLETAYGAEGAHWGGVNSIASLRPDRGGPILGQNSSIPYSYKTFTKAIEYLLVDYDKLSDNECYLYDIAALLNQHIQNSQLTYYQNFIKAYNEKDIDTFNENADKFLSSISIMDEVSATQKDELLGNWIGKANDRSQNYDDFSKDAFEFNAKALITTWGGRNSAKTLGDYAYRQYSGLQSDYVLPRWTKYINTLRENLENGTNNNISYDQYFNDMWDFILDDETYSRDTSDAKNELARLSKIIMEDYTVMKDVEVKDDNVSINAEVTSSNGADGTHPLNNVIDNSDDTLWVAANGNTPSSITLDLGDEFSIYTIQVAFEKEPAAQRGLFAQFKVEVEVDGEWIEIASDATTREQQIFDYALEKLPIARRVRVTITDIDSPLYPAVAEIRVFSSKGIQVLDNTSLEIEDDKLILNQVDTVANIKSKLHADVGNIKFFKDGKEMNDNDLVTANSEIKLIISNIVVDTLKTEIQTGNVDKTALKIAVDLANAITDNDLEKVIPVVADEFKAARDEANEVYNNASASQVEVNNAFDRLASAMQKLEFYVGDKTALKAFIDKVSSLDSSKYTTDTWAAFETELNEAIAVYEDLNAMQEEVNNAYSELVTAFLNLRLIPDKSLLEELINQANGLNAVNYTKATFDGLTKALNEAKAVYENPNATQEEVDNAKATLEKAIAGLQTVTTDNTVKTPVNNGDTTASVKTGDDALVGTLAGLVLLSVAGYTVFRRKEN